MQLRDLDLADLIILERDNTIPNLFNGPFKLIKSIDDSNGDLVGSFWARVTTESTMVFSGKVGKLTKTRALDKMIKFLYDNIPLQLGISDSFIIFERDFDPTYIEFLKRHYKFEEIKKTLRMRRNDAK